MTTKPTWTDEEKFWRSIRQAALALVDAIEICKLGEHTDVRTAEMRQLLRERQHDEKRAGVLTAEPERGKL